MCQVQHHRRCTATVAVMGWLVALGGLPVAASFLLPPSRMTHDMSSHTSFAFHGCRAGILDRSIISNNCNQIYPIYQRKRRRSYIPFPLAAASPSSTSSTSKSSTQIKEMSTSQLLQLLNDKNIRYAPNATRAQLEELVLQYRVSAVEERNSLEDEAELESRTFSKSQNQSKKSNGIGNQEVVDAIVLNEEEEDIDNKNSYPKETGGYSEQQPRGAYQQRRYNQDKSRGREADVNKRRKGNSQKRNPTASAKKGQRQQRNPRIQNNYDLYANTYPPRRQRRQVGNGDEFSLPDDKQNTYDNGLQIFLMGFYEAGKTGVQLGLDAINPFSSDNENGEWWYDEEEGDEEEGRDVLDVSILDYSPHNERGGESVRVRGSRRNRRRRRKQQRAYSATGRRSSPRGERRQQYDTTPRRQTYDVSPRGQAEYDDEPPPFSAQIVLEYEKYAEEERQGQASYSSPPYTNTSEPTATNTRRRRSCTYNEDRPRYGLYHDTSDMRQGSERNETAREYIDQRKTRQWKDRVRRKFDAALGLDYQAESWRSNMDELDDRRKEVLRRQMKVENDADTTDNTSEQASDDIKTSTPSLYRNNRRARMRVKSIVDKKQSPPTRRNNKSSPKSRLDEVPFWREGGTLASLLFDTRPSRDGKGYPSRRKSLEQLLLSPFGRHHTVTSLFLYISRSTLTSFSILCRWAGVRNTIPQPVVVLTAFAAVVSSRGGKRMLSLTLTLLVMRLVGEFIHGSLHGNEFWDDEYDKEAHDWEPRSEQ